MSQETPTGRVLIIEDDRDTRDAIVELLTDEGFDVLGVRGVKEALAKVDKESFSLIIADVFDRGIARWPDIESLIELADPTPVGACTASRLKPEEGVTARLAFFLEKPFPPERLLQLVAKYAANPESVGRFRAQTQSYFQALSECDWHKLGALCSDNVTYFFPTADPNFGKKVEGRDAFVRFSEQTFAQFKDAKFTLKALAPLEQGVVASYETKWSGGAATGAVVLRFDGEKICRIGVRTDVAALTSPA